MTVQSVTFISLGDPQVFRDEGYGAKTRAASNSTLNKTLNALPTLTWPTSTQVPTSQLDPSVAGMPIGPIAATFIAGDLCQVGGDYSSYDQFVRAPVDALGGSELKAVRALYQQGVDTSGWDWNSDQRGLQALSVSPVYFALGNHDVQSEYTPAVGWWMDGVFSSSSDFWRYQMYDFIGQMHAGIHYNGQRSPRWPVTSIDADGVKGYTWPAHSFNYRVDLGPVTIFNVHVFGGSDPGGQNKNVGQTPGTVWLNDELQKLPVGTAVLIVQHDSFMSSDIQQVGAAWSQAQRDAFLQQLAPYNVIGFMVGHVHDVNDVSSPQVVDALPASMSGRTLYNLRPGAAFLGAFAVYRVTVDTDSGDAQLDVAFGMSTSASQVVWNLAWSTPIEASNASRPMDVLVHLEGIGDEHFRAGQLAGTVGQSRRLEGFQLSFEQPAPPADIRLEYMAHIQGSGDTSWFEDGQFCGTRGQSLRLEGFAIKIAGPDAADFSVSYMAHLEGSGNTGFYRDGDFCGTRGQNRRVEAILVRVEPVPPRLGLPPN